VHDCRTKFCFSILDQIGESRCAFKVAKSIKCGFRRGEIRACFLDYGAEGIRANGVNADRIRSGLLTDDFIKERSQARGVSEQDYMTGNLLGREVTAQDVAQAFLAQALALKTTADVTTVDGGNIAAALR